MSTCIGKDRVCAPCRSGDHVGTFEVERSVFRNVDTKIVSTCVSPVSCLIHVVSTRMESPDTFACSNILGIEGGVNRCLCTFPIVVEVVESL